MEKITIFKTGHVCPICRREDAIYLRPYQGDMTECQPNRKYVLTTRSAPCGCKKKEVDSDG